MQPRGSCVPLLHRLDVGERRDRSRLATPVARDTRRVIMGNALVAMRSDPLEQVADFQKQPPTLQPLADTTEGTVLASQRPAPSATLQHTVTQLQSEFSGELGVTAPSPHSAARPGASAAVYLPRGDSAARGLVEGSGTGGKSYVVVQVPAAPSFPLAIASTAAVA